jgi:hypothetical protein
MPRTGARAYIPDMSYFPESPEPLLTHHQNRRIRRRALLNNPYQHSDVIRTTLRNRNSHHHLQLYNLWLQTERLNESLLDHYIDNGHAALQTPLYHKVKDVQTSMQGFLMKMMTEGNFFVPFETPLPPRTPTPPPTPEPVVEENINAWAGTPIPWPATPNPDPFLPVYTTEDPEPIVPIPVPNGPFVDTPAPIEYYPAPVTVPALRHPRGDVGTSRVETFNRISRAAARAHYAFERSIRVATPPLGALREMASDRVETPDDDHHIEDRILHPSRRPSPSDMDVGYEDLDHSGASL